MQKTLIEKNVNFAEIVYPDKQLFIFSINCKQNCNKSKFISESAQIHYYYISNGKKILKDTRHKCSIKEKVLYTETDVLNSPRRGEK